MCINSVAQNKALSCFGWAWKKNLSRPALNFQGGREGDRERMCLFCLLVDGENPNPDPNLVWIQQELSIYNPSPILHWYRLSSQWADPDPKNPGIWGAQNLNLDQAHLELYCTPLHLFFTLKDNGILFVPHVSLRPCCCHNLHQCQTCLGHYALMMS